MRKKLKSLLLSGARRSGLSILVRESDWRRRRLLILCWHGISLEDEHLWRPGLYMPLPQFRERLQMIRELGYRVLDLQEALDRLAKGDLPPRSVAFTFDDGFYDFYAQAAPALAEFGYPATVYLTTYHVDYQRPIFPVMVSYLLWKGCGPGQRLQDGSPVTTVAEADTACARILNEAEQNHLSATAKDDFLCALAAQLRLDYEAILRRRFLHLMNPAEVATLSSGSGTSFELHTHRHRTPQDPLLMARELEDNQKRIAELTGRRAIHFCYPSGVYRPDMFPVLERAGVRSATTCALGLAAPGMHPYLLPRLLDSANIDALTFESWLNGVLGLLPRAAS